MTLSDTLKKAINILKESNIENPISIAKIVLANILKQSKEYLLIHEKEELNTDCYNEYIEKINKIALGMPMQYITNNQEFMGMEFYVDEHVLIPRPDTEILVEEVLKIIDNKENLDIIDMCTGSGAIAISIAKYAPNNNIYAIDISTSALDVAKKNAEKNNVNKEIQFINSNMFQNLKINIKADIIVSNPPYIETETIKTLDKQVQNEPKIALDGGNDGLNFYRNILENSKLYLKENGIILMEIGYNQKQPVTNLFKTQFKQVNCVKDLSGNDRVIICKN